ncbi:MAG: carboxymuconolactone decarboxylase family protein, partial [Wenzhouxiangella sp.]
LKALREGDEIPDQRLAALSRFTRIMFETRGRPGDDDTRAFFVAGFEESHLMDIILALAVKTLSNYSNHINQPELDEAFASHKWEN